MNIEEKVKINLLTRGFDNKTQLNNRGLIEATIDETVLEVVKNFHVSPPDVKPVLPTVSFFGIKVVRYRIIKDDYLGYECQIWRLWVPFWCQMNFCNTHHTLEKAIAFIKNQGKVVLSS